MKTSPSRIIIPGILPVLMLAMVFSVSSASNAKEYEVSQKNKAFSAKHLKVKVGDVISFPNLDPIFHNVYSLSEAMTFDLGSYPKGKTRKITVDTPGVIEVECAIHPYMYMEIEVTP